MMKVIKLKKDNFRDLGGTLTKSGERVKHHKFLRGRHLHKLSSKDLDFLKNDYGLKTVIDLRTEQEKVEKPDIHIPGVEYFDMPILNEEKAGVSRDKKSISISNLKIMPDMVDVYKSMTDEESTENMIKVLKKVLTMEDDKYPVLFHCSAGKDRTGILAALILYFLGADDRTVMKDYLKTNTLKNYTMAFWASLGVFFMRLNIKLSKKLRALIKADKKYLHAYLKGIDEKYGSTESFLNTELGFSEEEKSEIKKRFLEA